MALPHGGNIYHYSREYGIPEGEFLDFSASINPLGPSKEAIRAVKGCFPSLVNYPDPDGAALKDELSARLDVGTESLLLGNGSTELIYLLPRALGARRAVVLAPSFSDYERAASLAGCTVSHIMLKEKNGFLPEMDMLKSALQGADIFFLCNPNNPTGTLLEKGLVLDIIRQAKKSGVFAVVDEAFIEYAASESIIREAASIGHAAVLRNFTKFYAMPGLRLGYIVAGPASIKKLAGVKEPWSVNTPAQHAARAALSDYAHAEKSLRLVERERKFLHGELGRIPGLKVYPASANFILARLKAGGLTADVLAGKTASRGVLIRSCSNFRGLGRAFFRVAVRTRDENRALLNALKEALSFTPA